MTTLTDLFNQARLLAGNRASYSRYFNAVTVAGIEYYGALYTAKDRGQWTAAMFLLREGHALSFQGYGATERDALNDCERYALAWAEGQKEVTPRANP